MGADLPEGALCVSKPDFDYFQALDRDPATAPAEFGTFRECVLPIVEAGRADLVTGPHRLDEHFDIAPAPGHSPGHVVFRLNASGAGRSSPATCFTICCRSITRTGISRKFRRRAGPK